MESPNPTERDEAVDLVFLANFVHQVVNPLNGIAGTLDNLVDGLIKEEFRREQRLRASRGQIEQCITLMRNLAFLVQGSGGVADADRRIVVLPQVIIEAAQFYQEDGMAKQVTIRLDDPKTQNRVSGHPELIRQVLMNIFDNGVKYGARGSSVAVSQWIQADSNMAIIRVRGESSYPMIPSELPHIFDLKYRGTNAKQVIASGTGLGLYICREIVEGVHCGTIHAQSYGISGLEFIIKLPQGQRG